MKMLNNWPEVGFVDLKSAEDVTNALGVSSGGTIVAVLKVTPNVDFYIGFRSDDAMSLSGTSHKANDGLFGMKLGEHDVTFYVFAQDHETDLSLSLVEYTTSDNPMYEELVVF